MYAAAPVEADSRPLHKCGGDADRSRRDHTLPNNLAVTYEQRGELEAARLMYNRALALDPDEVHFQENFTRFEIHDRRARPVANSPPQASNRTP